MRINPKVSDPVSGTIADFCGGYRSQLYKVMHDSKLGVINMLSHKELIADLSHLSSVLGVDKLILTSGSFHA